MALVTSPILEPEKRMRLILGMLSQLLNMVFSPEGDGLMLGSTAPSTHYDYTETSSVLLPTRSV